MGIVRQGFVRQGLVEAGLSFPLTGRVSGPPAPVPILKVGVMGDSIQKQNNGLISSAPADYFYGIFTMARMLSGCTWDFAQNAATGRYTFAEDGYRAEQVESTFLADCLASDADVVFIGAGINNALSGTNMSGVPSKLVSMADAVLADGKIPVILTLLPVGLNYGSNTGGSISAIVQTYNPLIRAAANAADHLVLDLESLFELTPGSGDGIGNQSRFQDGLHPDAYGALIAGRYVKEWMAERFLGMVDPYAGYTAISPNFPFTAGSSNPTNWTLASAPAGATLVSQSVIDDPDHPGEKIWQIVINQGASAGTFRAYNYNQVGGSYAIGDTVDGIMQVRVTEGSVHLWNFAVWESAQRLYPSYYSATTGSTEPLWEASDDWLTLRSSGKRIAPNPLPNPTWPELYFAGKPSTQTTIQIRRWGVCKR